MPSFQKLNQGWNAEPNSPDPELEFRGRSLLLRFRLNHMIFPQFSEADIGELQFDACARYRLGPTNDEGWFRGQCRYGPQAPAWGEFYELTGDDPHLDDPTDWIDLSNSGPPAAQRHFLFYLRDETFECLASNWRFAPSLANTLYRVFG